MSWYQRKRAELGMFVLREFPTVMEECFQAPVEGAIYAEAIDKLRVEGAIKPWIVDNSALVHTAWDLGSPVNTAVWYFQLGPMGEIRVIDCDLDLDIPPVERVARMLAKGYLYGSHFLPHDAHGHAEKRANVPERTQGSGASQLQGSSPNSRHLGRHQPAAPDAAALQLPHPAMRARAGGFEQLSHDPRDLDRHRERRTLPRLVNQNGKGKCSHVLLYTHENLEYSKILRFVFMNSLIGFR